jgi:hypothetical protein
MKCDKEKGNGRLGDEDHPVFPFLSLCHTPSPNLLFPFSLPHFLTQSFFFFLFATLHHPVFLFLEVWQREMKKKIG